MVVVVVVVVLYLVKTEFKLHEVLLTLLEVTVESELLVEFEETQQWIVLQVEKQHTDIRVSTLLYRIK